jgi:predicted glycoside hydrolase/deacetylase ChbG (UPF0249 family)
MLIINADDWGRDATSTDNSILCFRNGRVTSASSMVFMKDSERAAELAREYGLETGLHLNFTLAFDGNVKPSKLVDSHRRIALFLGRNKYCSLFYNPWLRKDFDYVYKAEYEEYIRLYRKEPTHIDGHHHMHLCTNMLVSRIIPLGTKVRRSFTFSSGEKNILNIFYREIIDSILRRRYTCTEFFFSAKPTQNIVRLKNIVNLAKTRNVELMVHPEKKIEFDFLMSDDFFEMVSPVQTGNYSIL